MWDIASGKPFLTLSGHERPVISVDFSQDGQRIATGSSDQTARIWDSTSGKLLQNLTGHKAQVKSVRFSPDGKRLVTAGFLDLTARVWDVETGKELLMLSANTPWGVDKVTFSSDGKMIASVNEAEETIWIWDATSGQELLTFPGVDAEFGPDENSILVFSEDNYARDFYLDTERLTALARSRLTRSLTAAECQQYLHLAGCPAP